MEILSEWQYGRKDMDEKELLKAIVQNDYCSYVKLTNDGWKPSRFHKYLCKTIQDFIESEGSPTYDILIINTPPQHGKSVTITETLPSWYLGRNPKNKVIEISYNDDFAKRFGRKNRQKIETFGGRFFNVGVAKNPNSVTDFELDNNIGGMISSGIESGVTGNKCNLMIIDDPVKTRQDADSPTKRNTLWGEWNDSYKTRLAPNGKVIVIMTRWHEDDLAGRLIANEKNVTVVNLPCEAEENDPLGREVGEALCPEIGKGQEWLKEFKASYTTKEGLSTWNALFQGRPTSAKGNILKREWWQYYEELPEIVDWVMSVDATFKDGDDNDFVAIQIWGKSGANIYLIDAIKKHLDMPSTVREIMRLRAMYPKCTQTLIEDKANGSAIIQVLRTSMFGIIPVNPLGGKVSRVNAVSGAIESGNVYLPSNKPFTYDFVEECASFPKGKHDDQVDSMSQALNRLIYQSAEKQKPQVQDPLEKWFPSLRKKNKKNAIGRGDKLNVI